MHILHEWSRIRKNQAFMYGVPGTDGNVYWPEHVKQLEKSRHKFSRNGTLKFAQYWPTFGHKWTKMASLWTNYTSMDLPWWDKLFTLLRCVLLSPIVWPEIQKKYVFIVKTRSEHRNHEIWISRKKPSIVVMLTEWTISHSAQEAKSIDTSHSAITVTLKNA